MKIITKNEQETVAVGFDLGRQCQGGEVFALVGELGAGKTKLLQGLAKGLGVTGRVNSPTFNIWKIYQIKNERRAKNNLVRFFCHLDAYRLRSAQDLINLGVEEYFQRPDTVVAIEWGERAKKIWPPKTKVIIIKTQPSGGREIKIS